MENASVCSTIGNKITQAAHYVGQHLSHLGSYLASLASKVSHAVRLQWDKIAKYASEHPGSLPFCAVWAVVVITVTAIVAIACSKMCKNNNPQSAPIQNSTKLLIPAQV
ncbi:MAG TPA: hypothetical protein VGJ00_09595 [Rhabdochlamydiaceae bacterium]